MPITYGSPVDPAKSGNEYRLPKRDRRQRPLFRLMVHPDAWTWDPVLGEWLPDVGKLVVSAGVAGVALRPDNTEDDSLARANYLRQGWTIIEDGDPRLADVVPGGRYLAKWPSKPHGHAYGWIWEGYEIVRGAPEWERDRDLRATFLRALVAKGFVPPMPSKLKELELRTARNRVRRLSEQAAKAPHMPSLAIRLKDAEALLGALEADFAGKRPKKEAA